MDTDFFLIFSHTEKKRGEAHFYNCFFLIFSVGKELKKLKGNVVSVLRCYLLTLD